MENEKWIDRYGPILGLINIGLALMAAHFAVIVFRGGSPITPEIYGPAVHSLPAIAWALVQMLGHGLAAIGSLTRRPILLILGGVISICVHDSFSALAGMAEQGTLLQAGALYVTLPLSIASFLASVGALKNV